MSRILPTRVVALVRKETLQILREMGVDRAQGNYIGRPREALISIAQVPAPAIAGVVNACSR